VQLPPPGRCERHRLLVRSGRSLCRKRPVPGCLLAEVENPSVLGQVEMTIDFCSGKKCCMCNPERIRIRIDVDYISHNPHVPTRVLCTMNNHCGFAPPTPADPLHRLTAVDYGDKAHGRAQLRGQRQSVIDGAKTFTYNSPNHLLSVTRGADVYIQACNRLGERYQQTVNGTPTTCAWT